MSRLQGAAIQRAMSYSLSKLREEGGGNGGEEGEGRAIWRCVPGSVTEDRLL